jgi:release factor glutamine methyltransferase
MRLITVGELVDTCAGVIGGDDGLRDAREILAAVLDVSRSWPALHSGESVSEQATAEAVFASRMRATGKPMQYSVGKAAFRHLTLAVDERVLIPRPETEMLVDIVLDRVRRGTIADIGTGSGAIALALATEGDYDRVIATDLSADALAVAKQNAARYADRIKGSFEFGVGSLLEPLRMETLDAVVSNPPYIADDEMAGLPEEVRDWEPRGALASGPDGLAATTEIIANAPGVLGRGGLLALEVDCRRAERTADILKADNRYEKIEIVADLTGRPRFVAARRR